MISSSFSGTRFSWMHESLFFICRFISRCMCIVCCIKVTLRQPPWDVQMFLISFCMMLLNRRRSYCYFSPISFSLCVISVSHSLSFALKSNQLPGFLFMSPGSDALASKLCKCILPVKLKPSLLVLRGLLHRVLHHSFGSGPSHFPP